MHALSLNRTVVWDLAEGATWNLEPGLARYVAEPALIELVVSEIREIERKKGLERTVAIGALVLQRFFGGSPAVWRDRSRNKNNSIRRLAEHAECPLSRSALNDAVAVHVALQALPCVRTSGHITASHVTAVLPLSVPEQRRWLDIAHEETLSVRQLKERIIAGRREAGERRGRPRAAASERAVYGVRSAIRALRRSVRVLVSAELGAGDALVLAALVRDVALLQAEILAFQSGPSVPIAHRAPSAQACGDEQMSD